MESVYIGRQPILNKKKEIVYYELLFRSGTANFANVQDDYYATSRVLINTLVNIGINKILGGKQGFINVNEKILMSNLLDPLDKRQFVIEILEDTIISAELIQKVNNMYEDGYRFALDDFVFTDENIKKFKPLFDKISFLKVDLIENNKEALKSKLWLTKRYDFRLLAEKVETEEEFIEYRNMGFELFQGYFFARPTIMEGKSIESDRMAVMEMVKLLHTNPEISEIEEAMRKYPQLTINLLKFINSAAIFTRSRINSIRQAITLLGLKKLMQWLLLMLYAGASKEKASNPLFQTASQRAKIMETLVKNYAGEKDKDLVDEAFLVGLLSLLDVLFHTPIETILDELNMAPEIREAILEHKGMLGQMLSLVEKAEMERTLEMSIQLNNLQITLAEFTQATLESYAWTSDME